MPTTVGLRRAPTPLIDAGVTRVVVAALDADPRSATRGVGALREAGIVVELAGGALEQRALRQNEGFRCWVHGVDRS